MAQADVAAKVDAEITAFGIKHNCRQPRQGLPLLPRNSLPQDRVDGANSTSWVISKKRNVIARLIPDHVNRRYDLAIESGVSSDAMAEAELGTCRAGGWSIQ